MTAEAPQRVFVTGATGFIGGHVLAALTRAGYTVAALYRDPSAGTDTPGVTPIVGDFLRPHAFADQLTRFAPDAVIHLAWQGVGNHAHKSLSQFDNISGSRALLETAAEAGAKAWIALGSQAEYGPHETAISETTAAHPVNTYGAAKLATYLVTREVAAARDMRFAWVRLFSCYGPGDTGQWLIPHLMRSYTSGTVPDLTPGEQVWDYLHVRDAADALVRLTGTPEAGGVFNLGSGKPITIAEVARHVRDRLAPGLDTGLGRAPYRQNQVMYMQADISRLTAATGWRPATDIRQGLDETVDWFLANTPA